MSRRKRAVKADDDLQPRERVPILALDVQDGWEDLERRESTLVLDDEHPE